MYLFIGHAEIKNNFLNKQVLQHDPWCSAVIRTLSLWSGMIRGTPGVICCPVSAPSAVRCSVASDQLVSVLLHPYPALEDRKRLKQVSDLS